MQIQNSSNRTTQGGNLSRREFIGTCATCVAGATVLSSIGTTAAGIAPVLPGIPDVKAKVKLVFAYADPEQPNWPNIGYDCDGRMRDLTQMFKKQCPGIDFLIEKTKTGTAAEAEKIMQTEPDVDGYIVFLVGCVWGDLTETITASGKPTVLVDDLYAGTGEFLTSYARAKRAGHTVVGISSSNFEDVAAAVNCFACLKKLQASTILVVGRDVDTKINQVYGTQMKTIDFEEINQSYKKINNAEAKKIADRWMREAEKVVEPTRQDIDTAGAMYLAMLDLMQQHNAQAITINCLGGIYSGKMVTAYPCLGFMQLDNDGLVGACEADQQSTITKLLMTYLVGRPGFISDPVIDTSKNQIIYAHCVGTTRVFGPGGPANPYHIRSHSENRKGACTRSLMPIGEIVTTIRFDHNRKEVILHQGKTVENVDEDKACRTKLAAEVKGDVFKLLDYWDEWGWHRVTFFGDHKRQVSNIAALLGFKVVEEA